eukprot:7658414-Alexandrium_andersonii.AAC.1
MEQGMFDTLDAREAELEEEREARALGMRGGNWKTRTQPKAEEVHPMEEEEAEKEEDDDSDGNLEVTRDKKGLVVAAKYAAKKKKQEPEHFNMDDDDDDEEEEDLTTSADAFANAKAHVQSVKNGGHINGVLNNYNTGKKKKGSSADAVWHAKSSLGYDGYDEWQDH